MFAINDDFSLLTKCIDGEQEAWDIFVKRYSKLVYHSILHTFKFHSFSSGEGEVEDIYNSIFLSLIENDYKKLRQFEGRGGCSLSSWIRLISVRGTIDFLRGRKNHLSLDEENETARPLIETLSDDNDSAEKKIERFETEQALRNAIDELPVSDKFFITLYYEKELSDEETAGIMNVSVNTIYSKKNRIREKIKKILVEKGFIEEKDSQS